jgi:hypothetical protein
MFQYNDMHILKCPLMYFNDQETVHWLFMETMTHKENHFVLLLVFVFLRQGLTM